MNFTPTVIAGLVSLAVVLVLVIGALVAGISAMFVGLWSWFMFAIGCALGAAILVAIWFSIRIPA